MLPALLLVGIGGRRRVWIPLPIILLWPFWLIGWVVWLVSATFRAPWTGSFHVALLVMAHLSSLCVDIDAADGERIHVRMI
jgi:hypothetical protein